MENVLIKKKKIQIFDEIGEDFIKLFLQKLNKCHDIPI